jgi:hypothetical protein
MAGANPMWVARQMGHATMQMTLTKYSTWIDRADAGSEKSKLEARFGLLSHQHKNGEAAGIETASLRSMGLDSRLIKVAIKNRDFILYMGL